jgi:hypothetical protein
MRFKSLVVLVLLCSVPPSAAFAQKVPVTNADNAFLVAFTIKFTITAGPGTGWVKLTAQVPQTVAGRQKFLEMKYTPEPAKKYEKDGNTYAEFFINKPAKTTELTISAKCEVQRYDLSVAAASKNNRQLEAKDALAKWQVAEQYLEKDAAEIQKAAKALASKQDEETVRNTMAFVARTMRKGPFDSADHGAVWALDKKLGDCTEYADLFVTLCRANGVPARNRNGFLIHDVPNNDTPKHDWAEAYLSKYGWVPFDPLHAQQGSASVERLRPIYVYLDNQRRNPVLNNFHFYSYNYQGDAIQVRDEFELKSRTALQGK